LKLQGRRFDTIEEIQTESQRVLDTLTEKDFQEAFQNRRRLGTGVYMRKGTTSRVMVADRPYGKFYNFYSVSPEYFGYTFVDFLCDYGIPFLLPIFFSRQVYVRKVDASFLPCRDGF
jgi:hypothetical protein